MVSAVDFPEKKHWEWAPPGPTSSEPTEEAIRQVFQGEIFLR